MIAPLFTVLADGMRRFVFANGHQRPTTLLVVLLLSWQITSCGILTEVPENLHDYPSDFARFLARNGAHGDYEDFVYFLKSHDVHQIVPVWQLLQQGSEWEKHQLPIKYDLIPYIGDVKVLSGFRTPHYNKLAGGAGKSRHLSFSALDLRPVAKIDRSKLHGILQNRWHSFGNHYNLGLGLYGNKRFHIDTGGFRQW